MDRLIILLIAALFGGPLHAEEVTHVVGEVVSITKRYENLTPQKVLSPLEVNYTVIKLANGNNYQLAANLQGIASSTIVELDTKSIKTESGYPLVVSGRTLSLVNTINEEKTILPLDKPEEFHEQQSN